MDIFHPFQTDCLDDFIIKIYHGEDKLAKNNKLLFEVKIDEQFNFTSVFIITIEIDKNGLINICARILNSTISKDLNKEYIHQYIESMYIVYNGNANQILN